LMGANFFHSFSAGGSDTKNWNMDIAREFIGNMKEEPLTGSVIRDANGAYLYPLQTIADSNRSNHHITVFCSFGWDGTGNTLFTGTRPTQTSWWNEYKIKLQQWALQFKDQPDVWLEVWNEPYRYDRADGYNDAIWLNDMNEMVSIIRNAGNNNIILVPCAEQGQDESVLLNQGNAFLSGKHNILFDVHAYEKWLLVSNTVMGSRLQQLQQKNLPVFFGETAPMNAGTLMNPQSFLDSAYNKGLSVCAWTWKYDGNDADALLDLNGLPNNNNNNNWGSMYKNYCARIRKP
jgi:mannan endo-1,4-beta-mannosidase